MNDPVQAPPAPPFTFSMPQPVVVDGAVTIKDLLRFETARKSAGIAFLLCWMFGLWGAHRFYSGQPHAVTMLVITIVSIPLCFIVVGFVSLFAVWVWMIADLFSVSRWVKDYNAALLSKITSGQG